MEQEKEKQNRQQKYLIVMALMKEMRSPGQSEQGYFSRLRKSSFPNAVKINRDPSYI